MPGTYAVDGAAGMAAGFVQTGAMTPEGRRLAPVRLMINTAKAAATPGLA